MAAVPHAGGSQAGRHVLVTGAGTGIGRAIALRLAAEGAAVTLIARRLEPLTETAAKIVEACGPDARCFTAACDIRDSALLAETLDAAVAAQGPLHAAVCNAGVGGANEPGDGDRFDEIVEINVTGSYRTARAVQERLAPGPAPRQILFVSSILARIGVPGYTGYCASKAALLGLTRALAMELAPLDIAVNAVCPGWVNTSMARDGLAGLAKAIGVSPEEAYTIAMKDVPLGRMSEPEDIAGTVNWLLSADARGATGQGFDVNGGAFMS